MKDENRETLEDSGLIFAYRLDGKGGGSEMASDSLTTKIRNPSLVWAHFDHENPGTREWLTEHSGLEPIVRDALLSEDPRPRSEPLGNGLILILRGINPNPEDEIEDMVSLRLWLEPHRIVSMRHRRILAATDLRAAIVARKGPVDINQFIVQLLRILLDRMDEEVVLLNEKVDGLEQRLIDSNTANLRTDISQTRRIAITLRRYIAPQRQAMNRLATEDVEWITDLTRANLREITDRLLKNVEDLDAVRERASIIQEELSTRIAERMNQTMYLISVFTALFLPLGFLTGLLGINVGGMPGTDSDSAFWWVCGILGAITVLLSIGLKLRKWI
jgi:zinc transporter